MKRGSITPFCALSLMLTVSLLFVLLESARVYTLERFSALRADAGIDSVCAEYQPFLWRQYGLLFLDGAYGTEYFSMNYVSETLEEQINRSREARPGWNLLSLDVSGIKLTGYALATDNRGAAFLNYAAEREKENLPFGIAEDLYEQYQKGKRIEEEYGGTKEEMRKAEQMLAEIVPPEGETEEISEEKECADFLKKLFSKAGGIKSRGILNLIFGGTGELSARTIQFESRLQERIKNEGNLSVLLQDEWYRKLLVLQYMEEFFSNYRNPKAEHFLCYEMEYVLCGEETETQNLSGALERILLLRGACNVTSLLRDEEKTAQAKGLASIIGFFAGENPAVVKTIQAGILAVWAYLESILDVRTLVAGERIALIKNREEWTLSLGNIEKAFSQTEKAKSCENGLRYIDYLKQLLFFTGNEKLAFRMMEAMELSLRNTGEYKNARMHQMLTALRFQIEFCAEPLFYPLAVIGNSYDGKFYFRKTAERSYVP